MTRKAPGDTVSKFRHKDIGYLVELRRKCERFAQDNTELLRSIDPVMPPGLRDRDEDNWTPVLAIGQLVGGDWQRYAAEAAMSALDESAKEEPARVQLLADMRDIFLAQQQSGDEHWDKLHTETLIAELIFREDRPWGDWSHGKSITAQSIARLLKPFEIKPEDTRRGADVKKGYTFAKCAKAFEIYLSRPSNHSQNATPLQVNNGAGFGRSQNATQDDGVAFQNPLKAKPGAGCSGVAGQNGDIPGANTEIPESFPRREVEL